MAHLFDVALPYLSCAKLGVEHLGINAVLLVNGVDGGILTAIKEEE